MSDGEYANLPGNVFLRRNLLVYVDVEGNICHTDCENVIYYDHAGDIYILDLVYKVNQHICS